eukprot:CAMPEP_0197926700 /NCGR_PEP_ID=MMETSP1439-20131203/99544_1 /TAXON_ID=66791 /ORGANISM="Gonyaulax spinifera, Strain CCMP409" /LENGTH=206 /DNA_ID=CAMNT_0043549243 /DNA_START=164 /DNA_END=786 /DNA_ORIENTATION=-
MGTKTSCASYQNSWCAKRLAAHSHFSCARAALRSASLERRDPPSLQRLSMLAASFAFFVFRSNGSPAPQSRSLAAAFFIDGMRSRMIPGGPRAAQSSVRQTWMPPPPGNADTAPEVRRPWLGSAHLVSPAAQEELLALANQRVHLVLVEPFQEEVDVLVIDPRLPARDWLQEAQKGDVLLLRLPFERDAPRGTLLHLTAEHRGEDG